MVASRFRVDPVPRRNSYSSDAAFFDALSAHVQAQLGRIEEIQESRDRASRNAYTVENLTPSRTLDAGAATLAETRAVLGTVVADLASKTIFRTRE